MHIKIGFDIQLGITAPMALIYLLHVHPSRRDDLMGPEVVMVEPALLADEYIDAFGNHCGRVNAFAGVSQVRFYSESVIRDSGLPDEVNWTAQQHDPTDLPPATLQFLLPSRYCEVDSELLQFAWNQFGQTPMGWARVQAICDWVNHHLTFDTTYARPTKTAFDAYAEARGVCRDFAHLAITLCRCVNIPARYATGSLGDIGVEVVPYPMDFSAWFEVYLSGRWHTFDARHNIPRIGRVVMARGRDAVDGALTTAFGSPFLASFQVWTDEVPEPGLVE